MIRAPSAVVRVKSWSLVRGSIALSAVIALSALTDCARDEQSLGSGDPYVQSDARHVLTFAPYLPEGFNHGVPAWYMAEHVDFVGSDIHLHPSNPQDFADGRTDIANYRNAGGKHVILQDWPMYSAGPCSPPFSSPAGACDDPMERPTRLPESAWLHQGSERVRYCWEPPPAGSPKDACLSEWRETRDPGSPATQDAYQVLTHQRDSESSGNATEFFALGLQTPPYQVVANYGGHTHDAFFGSYNHPSPTLYTDDGYAKAFAKLLSVASKPVFFRTDSSYIPAAERALALSPNVRGAFYDGCFIPVNYSNTLEFFQAANGVTSDEGARWWLTANALLNVTAANRHAICIGWESKGGPLSARSYLLASFWMTYDPTWSVISANIGSSDRSPTGQKITVYDEFNLVPLNPIQTAAPTAETSPAGDVRTLAVTTVASLYRREFADCFYRSARVGGCAAIVNASKAETRTLPVLSRPYGSALSLSGNSDFGGGRISWTPVLPATLSPGTAVILLAR
ncbi:MAG: hypothetical protein NVS3B20_18350 [Polyangiales bacterium]